MSASSHPTRATVGVDPNPATASVPPNGAAALARFAQRTFGVSDERRCCLDRLPIWRQRPRCRAIDMITGVARGFERSDPRQRLGELVLDQRHPLRQRCHSAEPPIRHLRLLLGRFSGRARLMTRTGLPSEAPQILPDTARVEVWAAQGFDLVLCAAVVAEGLGRKPSISTLKYFDG